MSAFLKKTFIRVLLWSSPRLSRGASILMYHAVDSNQSFLTVKPETFKNQLRYLKEGGFSIVPLRVILNNLVAGRSVSGLVSLTFDDGFENFYYQAWPLLKQYGIPATVFTPAALLGRDFTTSDGVTMRIMTPNMIQEIAEEGLVDFMPHTLNHVDLTQAYNFDDEINGSREALERLLSKEVAPVLAYPKGRLSRAVVKYLRDRKWVGAVGVNPGLVSRESDPFELPRNSVDRESSGEMFRLMVDDKLSFFLKVKNWLRKK